ncbi:hypothetical protein ACSV4D_09390 [Flavobacterium sp. ARAG 55.4]|uniref:hypothetical protein n=1 Tax=Flavobacterium sp. ARAG 55.4 TaxID=3451357 RepID=UPI003F47A04F
MILPFSTQLNGKPTYFVEKIWETIFQKGIQIKMGEFLELAREALPKNYIVGTHNPKLHTIRKDEKDRWKKGTMIDFFINCRQKDIFRFAPRIPVVSTQKIHVFYITDAPYCYNEPSIYIDDKILPNDKWLTLAQNDGFDTIEDFFAYFNEDFKGKIIHWTDLKY